LSNIQNFFLKIFLLPKNFPINSFEKCQSLKGGLKLKFREIKI